ncbi:peptidase M15B and M15C DD-carboxypeptidase VanY/endolysin [Gracilibacillus halophilus YIM-C55.5]|uniref:Peptidase M15B and M15C DD-carboxypeptidase VanY/endolysin n=1 Tax=Gracilibacillus halophilus YIM-C55.5 TaxID=1308866 RepID=N4WHQ7_9BACI|nr:peptidase M15B and M15C DD-carboxypeptidase VanY/endolysin [Gracilibacillus halophilus YIM-C55.5]
MRYWIYASCLCCFIALVGCQEEVTKSVEDQKQIDNQPKQEKQLPSEETEQQDNDADKENGETKEENQNTNESSDELVTVENPKSIEVVVNKQRKLPDGYQPPDLVEPDVSSLAPEGHQKRLMREEAATALESLFATAKEEGLELVSVSGYRSYDRQKTIYENNVAENGQAHADKFSAKLERVSIKPG